MGLEDDIFSVGLEASLKSPLTEVVPDSEPSVTLGGRGDPASWSIPSVFMDDFSGRTSRKASAVRSFGTANDEDTPPSLPD